MTLRVYGQRASETSDAIEYAWRKGAAVINMSFGVWDDPSNAVAAQLDSAAAHGVIVVAAAGNQGNFPYPISRVAFPARHPTVIAVGATDPNDVRWYYSNKGSELDLMAPSGRWTASPPVEIWTTDNYQTPGDYNPSQCGSGCPPENPKYLSFFTGTSASSPQVAAIAALVKSYRPGITPAQVRQRLGESAVDLGDAGPDTLYGYGRVDAYRAVTEWGTISGNVTWRPEDTADSTRYVSADLTIASGATLTIMPGTIVRIANDDELRAGADTLRVEINVEGSLVADGTSANPVVFESWHPQTTSDWVGIFLDSLSGGGTFDHCKISRAEIGIESWAPLIVTNTEIDSCLYVGILSRGGGAVVRGCNVTEPGYIGIGVESDSLTVRSTIVDGALAFGLSATGAGNADIDSACTFVNNDIGVFLYGSESTLQRSVVSGNAGSGVMCTGGDNSLIHANTLSNNLVGVDCSFSSPTVTENTITSNWTGVWVSGQGSNPDIGHYPDSGENTIALSTGAHIVNFETQATIYAQNNCWGNSAEPCGPPKAKIQGYVDTSQPQCCGQSMVALQPESGGARAVSTGLRSIVPNPFNPTTTIHYELASAGMVELRVYDVAGRLVRELVQGMRPVGAHQAVWNGTDRKGVPAASGVYFVRMTADGQTFTRKLVLLK